MCHKNGMCPVTQADFPVPVISTTASSGPQAAGVCPHDTSVKQEIMIFSGETEGETSSESARAACCRVRVKLFLTSPWPRFPKGPSRSQGSAELWKTATVKVSVRSFWLDSRVDWKTCVLFAFPPLLLCPTLGRGLCQAWATLADNTSAALTGQELTFFCPHWSGFG